MRLFKVKSISEKLCENESLGNPDMATNIRYWIRAHWGLALELGLKNIHFLTHFYAKLRISINSEEGICLQVCLLTFSDETAYFCTRDYGRSGEMEKF